MMKKKLGTLHYSLQNGRIVSWHFRLSKRTQAANVLLFINVYQRYTADTFDSIQLSFYHVTVFFIHGRLFVD